MLSSICSEVVEGHFRVDSKSRIEPFCGDMQKPPNENEETSRTQELQSELLACENLMICRRTESNDILLELVAKTLAVGATEMQVEYEDRKEHVLAFQEGVGFGIARLDASSEEAQPL